MLEILETFVNPIAIKKLNLDNQLGIDYLYSLKNDPFGSNKKRSNVGGWHSKDLKIEDNVFFKNLFEEITFAVSEFSNAIGFTKPLLLDNFWSIINGYKDHNIPHIHPSCHISGVYYLNNPENSGNIVFNNPDKIKEYSLPSEYCPKYNEYNSTDFEVYKEEGVLVLFLSHITHYVQPNLNENEERVIISFNYS